MPKHKLRSVNTRFWKDTYITELSPSEKLLFLYFLTCPLGNIAGIYEITIREIIFDTGLKNETIRKAFERFERDRKIIYINNYVIIKNHAKNQNLNKNQLTFVKNIINSGLPEGVLKAFESLRNGSKGFERGVLSKGEGEGEGEGEDKDKDKDEKIVFNQEENFEKIWEKYPKRDGKKEALKHFQFSVKNEADFKDMNLALQNYLKHIKGKELQFVKNGSTWFNNWGDWVNYAEPTRIIKRI